MIVQVLGKIGLQVCGKMNLPCKDSMGDYYIVSMEGIGAGLHFNGFGAAVLTCPIVKADM